MYPEHEKLSGLRSIGHGKGQVYTSDLSQELGSFLEWLESEGYILARWDHETRTEPQLWPARERIENLLGDYLGIDNDKLMAEKEQMLADIRERANQ